MNIFNIIFLFMHFGLVVVGIIYILKDFFTIKKTASNELEKNKLPRLLSRGVGFILLSLLVLVIVSFTYP
jgi:hypothetical protein